MRAPDDPVDGVTLPLVWDGTRLYLERYWRFERRVARGPAASGPGARWSHGRSQPGLTAILDQLFDSPARDPARISNAGPPPSP